TYGADEIADALDSLLSGRVTMSEKVCRFERQFAQYIGAKHAVMVNSGSSANLLALMVLANPLTRNHLKRDDEVIVPALGWSTTVFPIHLAGAMPVFVDIDPHTLNIDAARVRAAITPRTKALMIVHLVGNAAPLDDLLQIAREHNLFLVEDTCEGLGGEHRGKKLGTFGDLGTFSFYFSHHLNTIEGGMLVSDNDEFAELARVMRAHGWLRDVKDKSPFLQTYPDFDPRFLFINTGFNLRPTEINAAFGLQQLPKLESFLVAREQNADFWHERLAHYESGVQLLRVPPDSRCAWMSYPLVIKSSAPFTRRELVTHLEAHGIETRPMMAGNFPEQPVMQFFPFRVAGEMQHAHHVMYRGLLFGNHPGIGPLEREYVADSLDTFLKTHVH
ncbi:MAG: aminotransferase class I/II-fold pyridoxal phosphate-dependent enzyme, partial [Chloroflexi bacterium]|nr:aminotransferase class I/II-fold pyridoxal phosphate-dependent enzyme [Chloroflexota bacterium]